MDLPNLINEMELTYGHFVDYYQAALDGLHWFKHILLVNIKVLGLAKLRRKPSPWFAFAHYFAIMPLETVMLKLPITILVFSLH